MSVAAFKSRYDNVNGIMIHTQASVNTPFNSSPTIIMVHGLVLSNHYMMPLAKQLAVSYPVMLPELPGFGRSTKTEPLDVGKLAAFLNDWIRTAGLKEVVLIANSFGCEVIAEYAMHQPKELRQLVMISPMKEHRLGALQYIFRWVLVSPFEPISYYPIIAKDFLIAGAKRAAKTFAFSMKQRTEEIVKQITVPTLLIRGGRDMIVTKRLIRSLKSNLHNGSSVTIPRAAHAMNYSHPTHLAYIISGFLRNEGI